MKKIRRTSIELLNARVQAMADLRYDLLGTVKVLDRMARSYRKLARSQGREGGLAKDVARRIERMSRDFDSVASNRR